MYIKAAHLYQTYIEALYQYKVALKQTSDLALNNARDVERYNAIFS